MGLWDLRPQNDRMERIHTSLVDRYRAYARRGEVASLDGA